MFRRSSNGCFFEDHMSYYHCTCVWVRYFKGKKAGLCVVWCLDDDEDEDDDDIVATAAAVHCSFFHCCLFNIRHHLETVQKKIFFA